MNFSSILPLSGPAPEPAAGAARAAITKLVAGDRSHEDRERLLVGLEREEGP